MRLKSLEAYGFKSFADKIKLDFSDGVTCIVGPNGCGKSNVSDAIKWVLGEQKSSDLRLGKGKKMDQVIFKGTEGKYGRKPMTYCEVSLTFENEDRKLHIDSDEVVITRKMFNSGDSDYFINGKKDRLRNIIDLFRNTGVGKDGYSVIGQGKIDTLLKARPEEIRLIFEEAAGISKLRQNRKDSMNNLDKATQNLNVVEEKLHVLENVIEPLKVQAETAKKAAILKSDIKNLDINHFIFVMENSEAQIDKYKKKIEKADNELLEAKTKQDESNNQFEAKTNRRKEIDEEYTMVYNGIVELTKKLGLQTSRQKEIEIAINNAQGLIEEKNNNINEWIKKHKSNEDEIKKGNEDLQLLLKTQLELSAEEVNLKLKENQLIGELKEKREKFDVTNNLILETVQNKANISGNVATLTTENVLLQKKIEENNEKIKDNKEKIKNIDKETENESKKYDEISNKKGIEDENKKKLQETYFKKLENKESANIKIADARSDINRLVTLINYKESLLNDYGGFDSGVKFLMNSREKAVQDRVCGVVGRLIQVNPKYVKAVETALGGNINNVVTRDYQDTNFLIDYLNQTRGGRATFMPLSEMTPKELDSLYDDVFDEQGVVGLCADLVKVERMFRPAIDSLLGRVVVVETKERAAEIAKKYRKGFRIVTLDGENFAVSGMVTGGKQSGENGSVLSLESDIAEHKVELDKRKGVEELLLKEINLLNGELKEIEQSILVIDEKRNKIEKELINSNNNLINFNTEKDRLNEENKSLEEDNNTSSEKIFNNTIVLESLNAKTGNQNEYNADDANSLLKNMNEEINALENEKNNVSSKLAIVTNNKKNTETDIKLLKQKIDNLNRELETLKTNITETQGQIIFQEGSINELKKEQAELIAKEDNNESLKEENAKLAVLNKEKESIEQEINELHQKTQDYAELVKVASENKARVETQLENAVKEIEETKNKIAEDYELDYESSLTYKMEEYDDKEATNEIKNLKRKLASLGEINEKAISDLEIKQKEYDETKVQYDDCINSKNSILETINQLTKNMESRFKESFDIIRANFNKVYVDMFDGGHGDIRIDDKDGVSILDSGIIIDADPPGKKLHNIDLLSGGERALTAIALVFAIQGLNPAPFCVLDEVDSPLDDSNSVVYAKFLRKFSTNTQFIIVSHHKPTIELANQIFGITMEEKGVSKSLSVKLSEALKMADKGTN